MNRKTRQLISAISVVLSILTYAHAQGTQTPGQIVKFDPALNLEDSIISENTGNIGIATNPQARLHVNGTSWFAGDSTPLPIDAGAGVAVGFGALGYLYAFDYAAGIPKDLAINHPGGNVGIGTVSPATKLETAGSIRVTGVGPVPASGAGLELEWFNNSANVFSFDRGNGTFQPLTLRGSNIALSTFGTLGVSGVSAGNYGFFGETTATTGLRVGVVGKTNSPDGRGVEAQSAGGVSTNLGLMVFGRSIVTGSKSASVPLNEAENVLLYTEESTEVWFSDYGSVQLVDGRAPVALDPEFLQTIDTDKKYHVFVTANGRLGGSLYIDNKTPDSFEIRETSGTANVDVSYRIVAKRKDFAGERLKKMPTPRAQDLGTN